MSGPPKWMLDKDQVAARLNGWPLPRLSVGHAEVIAATAGFTEAEIHPEQRGPVPVAWCNHINGLIAWLNTTITELAEARDSEDPEEIREARDNRDSLLRKFIEAVQDRLAGKAADPCGCADEFARIRSMPRSELMKGSRVPLTDWRTGEVIARAFSMSTFSGDLDLDVSVTADDIEAARLTGAATGSELMEAAIHTALDRKGVTRDGRTVTVTPEAITIDLAAGAA